MNIIFLDIDGVLCTARSHMAYDSPGGQWSHWDTTACAMITNLCLKYDCRIVISSTWRMHEKQLFERLEEHKLDVYLHEDWSTPVLHKLSCERGHEIEDWLKRHRTEYETFIILDDNDDMLPQQKPFLVLTHEDDGISSSNYKDCINKLKIDKH